ncbi:MAG: hypothetical protein HC833_01855 [Leptolyngbyaceae cyanobacterium RM1_406_9]|nr:hypothetical protein [Leptolyngbyaceae cyanobacterium RM1_406_9]
MKRHQMMKIVLTLLSTLLLLLLWGTAVAQNNDSDKDIVRFGGNITIAEQQVVNNATAIAGSVTVLENAQVRGDAVAVGGDVFLKSGARVNGDVTAVGGDIFREGNVTVGGDVVTVWDGDRGMMHDMRRWGLSGLLTRVYLVSAAVHGLVVLAIAAIGLLLVFLVPQFLQAIVTTLNRVPLKSGAWGLGGIVAVILLSVLISGSLLGFLVLPIVNLLMIAAGLLGTIGMGIWIGQRTLPATVSATGRSLWSQLLVGMLILGVAGLIPVVGGLIFLVTNLFGLGAVLVSQLSHSQWKRFKHRTVSPHFLEPTDKPPQEMP